MYQTINDKIAITVNDWLSAGLSYHQFRMDRQRNGLSIVSRGIDGNTYIDVKSIRRRDRMEKIEAKFGKVDEPKLASHYISIDGNALDFFRGYRYGDDNDMKLPDNTITQYTNEASILNALREKYREHEIVRKRLNKKPVKKEWWAYCVGYAQEVMSDYPNGLPVTARKFEQKYKDFFAEGYQTLIRGHFGNKNTEKINDEAKEWLTARYASMINRCTVMQLFEEYNALAKIEGWKELRSEKAIDLFLNRPEVKPLWYGSRYGELTAKEKYTRINKTIMPSMRDSLWYGDGTKLNFFYLDENGNIKTCNVYEVIDVYSECLLGYHVSDTEDFEAQYHAYKMAMRFSGYKPYEIRFDNQGGHKKLVSGQFFRSLSNIAINTQPYNGKSKTIESLFGRFQQQVMHRHWCFTGQNITSKKQESKANREFLLSNKNNLQNLEQTIRLYEGCRKEWNEGMHPKTGIKRIEMYRKSENPKSKKIELRDMIYMFGVINPEPIKYRSNGITMTLKRQKYSYEVQTVEGLPDYDFLRKNVDRKFHIGYDPEDMTSVSLYERTHKDDYRFVTIAQKYIETHRNIQEQDSFDTFFLKYNDSMNKTLRIDMQQKTEDILEKHGEHPSQHGLNMPRIAGISKKSRATVGSVQKKESELVPVGIEGYDEADIYNRV
ncbi:MAG: transposase family protein [Bacteroidales bacterium]|jgi:hypothetical protein|nr:transposase family protein [Bacteroidales bacterium]